MPVKIDMFNICRLLFNIFILLLYNYEWKSTIVLNAILVEAI